MASKKQSEDLREACGLFGCLATGPWPTDLDVANVVYLGLLALQHRGQEGAGITTSNGDSNHVFTRKVTGLISHGFSENDLQKLEGNLGIGHTRYSTLGGTDKSNVQPFVIHTKHGLLSVAHNGELVNADTLRKKVLEQGIGLSTGSDSELITQILAMSPPDGEPSGPNWPARILHLMSLTEAAYSLLVMHGETIYAVRDPYGNRPLCLGKLFASHRLQGAYIQNKVKYEGYVVSSESCSFSAVSGQLLREVQPGEIVEITKSGLRSVCTMNRPDNKAPAFCIFEYVYFASPDSIIEGQQVYSVRKECGRQLAIEAPVDADIVSSIPDSATPAAYGFSMQSGIPFVEVLLRDRFAGRTFIEPSTKLRQQAVAKKFRPIADNFKNKRIVLIDDSIVRGNTICGVVHLLKECGAKEVHIRVASPPLHYPCYMGINIPTKEELIANKYNMEELAARLNVESLVHLSVEGLEGAVRKNICFSNGKKIGHCMACLTGNYPTKLEW